MSKILEEDLMTKRNFKGDADSVTNKTVDSLPSPLPSQAKSASNFDWDDFDIEKNAESAEASLSVIDSKAFEFSPMPKDQTLVQKCYEVEDEFLTQENLDRTFNNDCYKLCFNTTAMSVTQNFSKFNFKKIVEEQISEFNNEETNQSILNVRVSFEVSELLIIKIISSGFKDLAYVILLAC